MDKVYIKNLKVEAIIGIFEWEREVKQIISVDIEMDFDNKKVATSDDIEDALDYKKSWEEGFSLYPRFES